MSPWHTGEGLSYKRGTSQVLMPYWQIATPTPAILKSFSFQTYSTLHMAPLFWPTKRSPAVPLQQLKAYLRTQDTIHGVVHEQWKVEGAPGQRLQPGSRVELRSVKHFRLGMNMVAMREGVIGKRVYWEQRWVEYQLDMDGPSALSVTVLVPLQWVAMSLMDRLTHYLERTTLPDITPGPFPRYVQGEPQKWPSWSIGDGDSEAEIAGRRSKF